MFDRYSISPLFDYQRVRVRLIDPAEMEGWILRTTNFSGCNFLPTHPSEPETNSFLQNGGWAIVATSYEGHRVLTRSHVFTGEILLVGLDIWTFGHWFGSSSNLTSKKICLAWAYVQVQSAEDLIASGSCNVWSLVIQLRLETGYLSIFDGLWSFSHYNRILEHPSFQTDS